MTDTKKERKCTGSWGQDVQGGLCPRNEVTNVESWPRGHFCAFAGVENKVAPFPARSETLILVG